jgi:hypothetical protein
VLNVGGYRFETSCRHCVDCHTLLRRLLQCRYAQDVGADGSIFIDRDGEHFGHVLRGGRSGGVTPELTWIFVVLKRCPASICVRGAEGVDLVVGGKMEVI